MVVADRVFGEAACMRRPCRHEEEWDLEYSPGNIAWPSTRGPASRVGHGLMWELAFFFISLGEKKGSDGSAGGGFG